VGACHLDLDRNGVNLARFHYCGPGQHQRSYKTPKNLEIFAAETLHICLKTRTMRRLLGPARVKACLPLIDLKRKCNG